MTGPRRAASLAVALLAGAVAAAPRPPAARLRAVTPELLAHSRFYLHSFEQLEAQEPELSACGLSLYALSVYARLEAHPSRTTNRSDADVEVFAPYSLVDEVMYPYGQHWDHNWGRHFSDEALDAVGDGKELFSSSLKWGSVPREHRVGCADLVLDAASSAAAAMVAAAPGRRMLFFTSPFTGTHVYSVERLQKTAFGRAFHSHVVWASLNFRRRHFRAHDVSLPSLPLAALHPTLARGLPAATTARSTTNAKRYLVSFIGSMRRNIRVRQVVYERLRSRTSDGALVVDSVNDGAVLRELKRTHGGDFYNRIMALSRFSLVLRGDRPRSFRFAEAVCSGGVPVFVDDLDAPKELWEVPFAQVAQPDTYTLSFSLEDVDDIVPRLQQVPTSQYEALQRNALRMCHNHMASIDRVVDTTLAIAAASADGSRAAERAAAAAAWLR